MPALNENERPSSLKLSLRIASSCREKGFVDYIGKLRHV